MRHEHRRELQPFIRATNFYYPCVLWEKSNKGDKCRLIQSSVSEIYFLTIKDFMGIVRICLDV